MPLFKITNSKLTKITANTVKLEKELQSLIEQNLENILDITFVASEYTTSFGGRIDTLAIDMDGTPVIIEYKRGSNDNVINQGLSYLKWLVDHKAEFNELCRKIKFTKEIDWSSPRVICIAQSFNKFDLDTVDILPLKIELYRYVIFDKDLLYIELEQRDKYKLSQKFIKQSNTDKAESLQLSYTLSDHLKSASSTTEKLFYRLRDWIMTLDNDVIEEYKKYYIAYKLNTNFVDIVIKSNSLKLYINMKSGTLKGNFGEARDLENPKHIGHWGNGDYEVRVEKELDLEFAMFCILQSYEVNK